MNLAELLGDSAARFSDKTALVDGDKSVSYSDLWEEVCSTAQTLKSAGITGESMIGLQMGNSIAFVVISYALWRCNAVVVPIPAEMRASESAALGRRMSLNATISGAEPDDEKTVRRIDVAGASVWISALKPGKAMLGEKVNAAFVRFTSGTTSSNKGVVLSHERILDRISAANELLQVGPDDTVMWRLPMSHHFVVTITRYLWKGATIVLLKSIESGYVLNEIAANNGSILYASPFHYDLLAKDKSDRGIDSVRYAISTTSHLSADIASAFRERFGAHLIQAYGIIELGLVCVNTDDPTTRPLSVGHPMRGFSLRLANTDRYACADMPLGEVEVSGPGFFDAYYDPWIPADEIMNGGWFHTGDIGGIDDEGFLFLYSRVDSVINTAGMKLFPEEIEDVLNSHESVRESRVYGVKHAHLGEVPEAEVVLRHNAGDVSEKDVRIHCGRSLSLHKVPNRILFVKQLARTQTTGKIKRHSQRLEIRRVLAPS